MSYRPLSRNRHLKSTISPPSRRDRPKRCRSTSAPLYPWRPLWSPEKQSAAWAAWYHSMADSAADWMAPGWDPELGLGPAPAWEPQAAGWAEVPAWPSPAHRTD